MREHWVVLFDRQPLLFIADRGRAVGQRDDVITLLVAGAHRRLDAAVGQEPAEGDVVMPPLRKMKSRFVVANASSPLLPSTTISVGPGVSSSTISAPQVSLRNDLLSTTALRMPYGSGDSSR